MEEWLQEFTSSRDVPMRVDRQQCVIRGVKLLGLASQNGRRYLPAALAQAVGLYEGAKVNVNHPKGHPLAARDYQDRLGAIRNVRVQSGEGLFGDLHFNPRHALAEQLLWDAEHAPENVGFSHNVSARTARQADQVVVEAILKVQSVDLVADPASTRGLYESTSAAPLDEAPAEQAALNWQELTLEALQAARPDLVAAVAGQAGSELAELRSQLDRLSTQQAAHERRALAVRLIRESRLPDPDLSGEAVRPLVSESFVQSLVAADSERAMRELIEERKQLILAARQFERGAAGAARPTSREQFRSEPLPAALDARSFAAAIS